MLPSFYLLGEPAFSRGANTHPLLSLVCYQVLTLCYFSHPNTPHRSGNNIYIDDINNISRSRLIQQLQLTSYHYLSTTHPADYPPMLPLEEMLAVNK
jgi:hypothetical protein